MAVGSDKCIFCAVLAAIVGLVTIIVNIFNIIILCDKSVLKKSTRVLQMSVSIADLMVGIIVTLYVYPGYTGSWNLDNRICDALGFILFLSLFVSIWSLCCLSMDRYMALKQPLNYHMVISIYRVYVAVATTWILGAVISALPLFGIGHYHFNTAKRICGVSPETSPIYLYVVNIFIVPSFLLSYIMSILFLRLIRLQAVQRRLTSSNNQNSYHLRHIQSRALLMIVLIVLVFTIAWIPALVGSLIQGLGSPISPSVEYSIWWLAVCNSFFNFFIYCVTNGQYRQRLVWLFKCRCRHWKRQASLEVYNSVRRRLRETNQERAE